jgi:hypothetical protein
LPCCRDSHDASVLSILPALPDAPLATLSTYQTPRPRGMAYWRRVHGNCYILLYRISSPLSYHVCPMAPILRLRLVVASGEHLQLRLPDAEIPSISGESCLVVQALYNSAPHVHRRYRNQGLRKQIAISGRVCSFTAWCLHEQYSRIRDTTKCGATCYHLFPPELVQQRRWVRRDVTFLGTF